MQRKLIKVGTSAAVLIPKAFMDELSLKIGDIVHIRLSKKPFPPSVAVDLETRKWIQEFEKEYGPLLKKLHDK